MTHLSTRRLLSFAELKTVKGIPFSRQWLAVLIQQGKFPAAVKPGGGSGFNCWLEDEIDAYLAGLAAARNGKAA